MYSNKCIMYNNNTNGSRAAPARGFMGLFAIVLAMGLGLMAFSAEAAPFAYVTNAVDGTVSVIDTATTPRPWWPRSRWGLAARIMGSLVGSPSPRMGHAPMSWIRSPAVFR